jgi:tripartite-type tricarboxylate transporter receptor subunit TctC
VHLSQLFKQLVLSMAAVASTWSTAQIYPSKPLTMVVAYPSGGASDFVARIVSKEMAANLNQSITVENISGAAGGIGTAKVLNAAPDGYTLLLGSPLEAILTPLALSAVKYKPEDLKLAALLGRTSVMLLVRKELEASNFEEFLKLAKKSAANPLSYCTPGLGSLYHLMGEKLSLMANAKTVHVPYPGLAPCATAVMGAQIDFAFMPIAGSVPGFVDSGIMRALAVTSAVPSARLPSVPLMKNTKGFEDFVFNVWAGIHVAAKVPDTVIATINKSAFTAASKPETRKSLISSGAEPAEPMNPSETADFYRKEIQKYQGIAKAINLQQQ